MSDSLLTVVLPTCNRPAFLARALRYYDGQGLRAALLVADSSDEPVRSITAWGALRGTYRRWSPRTPFLEKLREALDLVTTPYVAIGADDDFFVPGALEHAARFLAGHPEWSIAHGHAALVALGDGAAKGRLAWAAAYRQRALEQSQAAARLRDHLLNYAPTWYSVHRSSQLRDALARAAALELDVYFGELLPSCLSVAQGRVAKLDVLYMVRQVHAGQDSLTGGKQLDLFSWITQGDWPRQYKAVQKAVAGALMAQDGISRDEAREIVRESFWGYLAGVLSHDWRRRYGPRRAAQVQRLREAARRWPAARSAWRALRMVTAWPNGWSLESLRHPANPHAAPFAAIERALAQKPLTETLQRPELAEARA